MGGNAGRKSFKKDNDSREGEKGDFEMIPRILQLLKTKSDNFAPP